MFFRLFIQYPALFIGLFVFISLILLKELGYLSQRFVRRFRKQKESAKNGKEATYAILTAIFGLLGLFIGFTFAMALDRYDTRRVLMVDESNAIGTSYFLSQLYQEPMPSKFHKLLKQYVDARINAYQAGETKAYRERYEQQSVKEQSKLWALTMEAVNQDRSFVINVPLVESLNESFDLAAKRLEAAQARIPWAVFETLIAYALLSGFSIGFFLDQKGQRTIAASTLLFILLSMVITLVIDLDQPMQGQILVYQHPMRDLQQLLAQP